MFADCILSYPIRMGEGERIQKSELNPRVGSGQSILSYGLHDRSPANTAQDPLKCLVWESRGWSCPSPLLS